MRVFMKYLPLGNQNFKELITKNYLYIDKTKWIYKMLSVPKGIYFLSRPRRFGKTLTVSTLFHLFKGHKQLFKDTFIYDKWDFEKRPVIRLDMNEVNSTKGIEVLEEGLNIILQNNAEEYGIKLTRKVPSYAFAELIKKMDNPVLLIDEYDKLILNNLHKPKYVEQIREALREFYGVIKSKEADLSFIFMTGISKFSKMSMNNLTDLSLREDYASILGLTDQEIDKFCREYIDKVKKEKGFSEEQFWQRLKEYYNGFSFDGKHFLYNPYSILNFFDTGNFENYWFESGTPSHLIKLIKNKMLKSTDFVNKRVSTDFISRRPIESTSPESFLFQSGYLTIKDKENNFYYLDYPNTEVKSSFNDLFLDSIFELDNESDLKYHIISGFKKKDFEEVFKQFQLTFNQIPYPLYKNKQEENIYHVVLLTLLWASGIKTTAEDMSNLGRSDIVIEFADSIYVMELKRSSAKKALDQIKDKAYYKKYIEQDKNIFLVGIEISDEKRNLEKYIIEHNPSN